MGIKPAGCELLEYKVAVDNTVLSTTGMILHICSFVNVSWILNGFDHLMLDELEVWFLLLKYFTDHCSIHAVLLMHLS